jgi:hypothetical protein
MNRDQGNRQALQKSLAQLRAQADHLEFRDSQSRQKLEQLIADVELHLDNGRDRAQLDDWLQGAPKTIAQFEIEHPALATSLSQIISALSSMGI